MILNLAILQKRRTIRESTKKLKSNGFRGSTSAAALVSRTPDSSLVGYFYEIDDSLTQIVSPDSQKRYNRMLLKVLFLHSRPKIWGLAYEKYL